jgi:hypothetical protein
VLFFAVCAQLCAASYHFEIFMAYNQTAMTDYNQNIADLNNMLIMDGLSGQFQKLDHALLAEASWVVDVKSLNSGDWGFYVRAGRLNLIDDKSKIEYDGTKVYETLKSDYSVNYSCVGIRKYFGFLYAGADAGGYFNWGNNSDDILYVSSDGINYDSYEYRTTWDTFLIGFNLEAGIDYWIGDSFGIAARAGYRIVKGKVSVDLGPEYQDEMVDQNVDYSGMYIGAGIMIALKQEAYKGPASSGW